MKINMIGKKYGKLTVIKESGKDHRGFRYDCKCECGGHVEYVAGSDLRAGHKTSCGCNLGNRRRTHGFSGSRPYHAWSNMKRRCNDPTNKEYSSYGGRGITYCAKWETFEGFWEDMQEGYAENLTLDRKDTEKGYYKDNCRWIDLKTQENNRTNNRILEYQGKSYTMMQLCEKLNLNYNSVNNRIQKGMSVEEAINIPLQEQITFKGMTKSVSEHAQDAGLTYHQLKKRLMRGWSVERALTQPLRK